MKDFHDDEESVDDPSGFDREVLLSTRLLDQINPNWRRSGLTPDQMAQFTSEVSGMTSELDASPKSYIQWLKNAESDPGHQEWKSRNSSGRNSQRVTTEDIPWGDQPSTPLNDGTGGYGPPQYRRKSTDETFSREDMDRRKRQGY